jgi:pyridoxamine 5'-phosphate oxidase
MGTPGAGLPGSFDQAEATPIRAEQLPEPLPADPFPLFTAWFAEAHGARTQPNPNAMTLCTVDEAGRPSARTVLCKALEPDRGALVFYTNYQSRKGRELDARPRAALLFHWDALDRQVRIEGPAARTSPAESDAYFATRPWESRIGAWSSDQSRPVASRRELRERVEAAMRRFGLDPGRPPPPGAEVPVPRPPHWGGYRVFAERAELWVSGRGRIHDRAEWRRELSPGGEGFRAGPWSATRLQP